ncbi:hypothetical protein ABLB37_18390 [Vibrio parahaemolyticus]|uniref:Cation transporter n=12 Tax=Vibrionaceae TaxID=641 RepID=A0A0D1TDZ9_VIBPH|nr:MULTISPECIES: hypothetical protein [Vibrio]EJG0767018.1 hypothetical protein [Vibrio parahaemolyticus O5:K30]EJG0874932.1 hypothetical protein [Vibrio parahaemolyticus O3]EJG0903560.1 hypothetical protein [Vibrio parahaemolyticus O3:K56]EJG0920279.1 hypothetical protein [Vibrio parahaemolyticus O1:K68]EJG0929894.1 hypothetical protein [Vibrio parahaemolyticus O1]EJG0944106.1 hypothetical protein [Vibrio parahaemolyticus O10]EJG0951059.1 hypothetical protein [Vibrio parahaemolyticus O1:K58
MERDTFGICLNKAMLSENMYSTFTHVRAYEKNGGNASDLKVLLSFPQMSGKDLLNTMRGSRQLEWRAEFHCPRMK